MKMGGFFLKRGSRAARKKTSIEEAFMMRVRVAGHSFRCGHGISENEKYATVLEPVEQYYLDLYGPSFEIYSATFCDILEVGQVYSLLFIPNPEYDPKILCSQPLKIFMND